LYDASLTECTVLTKKLHEALAKYQTLLNNYKIKFNTKLPEKANIELIDILGESKNGDDPLKEVNAVIGGIKKKIG